MRTLLSIVHIRLLLIPVLGSAAEKVPGRQTSGAGQGGKASAPAASPTTPPAADSGPASTPFLRLETGMHTAAILRIGLDAANRYLVTGSEDKTVRVWELATGRLLRTLRLPIGGGNEGKVFAVALSPDGTTVAAGGRTGDGTERSYAV